MPGPANRPPEPVGANRGSRSKTNNCSTAAPSTAAGSPPAMSSTASTGESPQGRPQKKARPNGNQRSTPALGSGQGKRRPRGSMPSTGPEYSQGATFITPSPARQSTTSAKVGGRAAAGVRDCDDDDGDEDDDDDDDDGDDDDDDDDSEDDVDNALFERVMNSKKGQKYQEYLTRKTSKSTAKKIRKQLQKGGVKAPAENPNPKKKAPGESALKGTRIRCAVLATGAFVNANKVKKVAGEIVHCTPHTDNCHAKKAFFELLRYSENPAGTPDKELQAALNNEGTGRRSEHLANARNAARRALLYLTSFLVGKYREDYSEDELETMTECQFYNGLLYEVLHLDGDCEIALDFEERFFDMMMSGLTTACPNFRPRAEVLFGEGTTRANICDEITKPILVAAIATVRVEPVPDGVIKKQGIDGNGETVHWQVNEVLSKNHKSVYEHLHKYFNETIWLVGYRFQFGPGRFAGKLLEKNIADITEKDAVGAFIPYLDHPTNGPGFDDNGDEISDDNNSGKGDEHDDDDAGDEDNGEGGDENSGEGDHGGGGGDARPDPPDQEVGANQAAAGGKDAGASSGVRARPAE